MNFGHLLPRLFHPINFRHNVSRGVARISLGGEAANFKSSQVGIL